MISQPKSKEQFSIFRSAYQVKELIDKFTTSLHTGQNTHFNKTNSSDLPYTSYRQRCRFKS